MKKDSQEVNKKPKLSKNSEMVKDKVISQDVEMKSVENDAVGNSEETRKDADLLTVEDIRQQIKYIERAVSTKEPRFMSRVLRALVTLRKRLNVNVLKKLIQASFTGNSTVLKDGLLDFLDEPRDAVNSSSNSRPRTGRVNQLLLLPEVEMYLHLLVLIYLLDHDKLDYAVTCADLLMEKIVSHNRRTLDMLAAKCYFYYSRTYELKEQLDRIRNFLHSRLRTCTLRSDHEGQACLLNLLLRNYLAFNLYDQADKLVSKSSFPDNASNNELARYHYYLGRIKAIQLEYSEARRHLLQATRKAPQHTAVGFKQTVQKFAIVVELLLGDIPDKSIFRQPSLRRTLQPYFQLTQAVRTGKIDNFNATLIQYADKFKSEGTYTLIIRLRHNVIKTGIRMINIAYLRISLDDVSKNLSLGTADDAEFILAKAIRDGVIEATINHEQGYIQSKENIDVYSTHDPMSAFHQRISFCLDIHNQSVKAMRFPPKSYNKDLESAEERREREQQELESAKEIADEDFDEFP